MYFTILYGVLDVLSGDFTFAAAGHPGPVLIRCNGQPEMIAASAYPVGVSPKPDYQDQTLKLAPGDKLILYTDGVVEALSSRDITFGEGRFLKALSKTADKPIEECLDKVMKSLESWACHVNLRDDLSLIGIEAYM